MKHIYFLRPVGMEGPIKIGCSNWPANRLQTISNWSPVELELIAQGEGTHRLERAIHRVFASSRLHQEWFAPSPELNASIAAVAAGSSVEEAFGLVHIPKRSTYGHDQSEYVRRAAS